MTFKREEKYVVAEDWPMYEDTWKVIEEFVNEQ